LFRPHTLTASFIPVLIGCVFARRIEGKVHVGLLIAMLLASILIQAATNMFNEYYDYVRGLDSADSVGIAGAITKYGMKARTVFQIALSCLFFAGLLGVYICFHSSWWLAVIGLTCMAVGYLYTGGPYPIAYTPFGELFAGLFMGTGIILISYFIQTGEVTLESFLLSIPSVVLIGTILMSNNIRDREGDKKNGRRTLAVLLGHKKAVKFMAGMLILTYLWIIFLVGLNILPLGVLLVLLSIPSAGKAIRGFREKTLPVEMMPGMKAVAGTNTFFGLLLCLALLI